MVRVRRLTSNGPDIDAASRTLEAAFAYDQLTYIVSGDVPGLHAARMRATVITGVLDLIVYAAEDEDTGEMLGVLVLKPPGIVDRASANADGPHADEVASLLEQDPSLVPAYTYLRSHVHTLEESVWGPTGVTDIWFISFIGVLESARGRGVGRLLCDLARDDAHGKVGLVAITAEGVAFYERLGYVTKGYTEFTVRDVLARRWAMTLGDECVQ